MAHSDGKMKELNYMPFKPMKKTRGFKAVVMLSLFGLLMSGCYAPPVHAVYTGPRFREAAQVNVVLQFLRWDSILITQPEFLEDGFLRLFARDDLSPMLTSPQVGHDLAVVIIGPTYQDEQLVQVINDWKALLNGCGFKRVVCLRVGADNKIDGLPIIDDTSQPVDAPKQSARL